MERDRTEPIEALLARARAASPNDRIDLRDEIASSGPEAVAAILTWLDESELWRFAIKVIGRAADLGQREASIDALRVAGSNAPPAQRDAIDAELARLGAPGSPSGSRKVARQPGPMHRVHVSSDNPAAESYLGWQRKLEEHFLRPSSPDSPWTLFIDDSLASSMKGESGDLIDGVRDAMGVGGYGIAFEPLDHLVDEWTKSSRTTAPPVLPILSASVIAATRMATDGVIAPHNYYTRFRELLGIPGAGSDPGYAASIPRYWELLGGWLLAESAGRFGKPTFRRHPRFTRIGYAISQALLRRVDRQRFPQFFRWRGLRPGQKVQPDVIIRWFDTWASRHGISGGIKTMLHDKEYRQQLANVLAADLVAWDGLERDFEGRVQIHCVLATESPRSAPTLWAVGERRGVPMIVREGIAEYHVEGGPEGYVGQVSRDLTAADVFVRGVRLRGDREFISLRAAPVLVFGHDDALGMWATRSTFPVAERLMIIAAPGSAVAVEEFLQSAARPGWLVQQQAFGGTDSGSTYLDVTFDDLPVSADAPEIASLLPPPQAGIALSGGLPILGERGIYLQGGEPDVVLDPNAVALDAITIDGAATPVVVGTNIRLKGRGLGVGHHDVRAGGTTLAFDLVAAWADVSDSGWSTHDVRWKVTDSLGRAFEIDGAYLSPGAPQVAPEFIAVVPQGARFGWLLGRAPGEILDISRPLNIPWLATYGMYGGPLDMVAPFPVAFAAYRTQLEGWVLIGVNDLNFDRQRAPWASAEQVDEWRDAVLRLDGINPTANADLWADLCAEAKAMVSK